MSRIKKTCENCSNIYLCIKSRIAISRFCCRRCQTSYLGKTSPKIKKNIILTCAFCCKEYKEKKTKTQFCSRVCWKSSCDARSDSSKVKKMCDYCSQEYDCRKDKINSSRFCSRLCLNTFAGKKSAENLKERWNAKSDKEIHLIMQERFEKFFEKTDGCWEWQGNRKKKLAYGCFRFRGKNLIAHRASYEIYIGPIPEKLIVMHSICDNPPCVNFRHLKVGTYLDNHKDKMKKGRGKVEKLTLDQVLEIKKMLRVAKKRVNGTCFIAKEFGVSQSTIWKIKTGKLWAWVD